MLKGYHYKTTDESCFLEGNPDPDIGWKFHLNVSPQNVVTLSHFLKENDFEHKYLKGGEVDGGKVFTVYSGSKQRTESVVRLLTDQVNNLLEEPVDTGQVLFAPKISGRFVGSRIQFHQYGTDGISRSRNSHDPEDAKKLAWELYGEYYGGGIEFYDPDNSSD